MSFQSLGVATVFRLRAHRRNQVTASFLLTNLYLPRNLNGLGHFENSA